MLWTTEYLNRLAVEAESNIAQETKAITDRISLPTEEFQAEFLLPEYVFNVKKVYWKGERLTPISSLGIDSGYSVLQWTDGAFEPTAFTASYLLGAMTQINIMGSIASGGKPFEYFYYGFGENKIRLNPGSNERLDKYNDGLWNEVNLKKTLVVEFYRYPDGANFQIPGYIRRRTIKAYVMAKAYAKEGPGQSIKAARYFEQRYAFLLNRAKRVVDRINHAFNKVAPMEVCGAEESINGRRYNFEGDYGYQGCGNKARPVLPSNYGIVVDD